MAENKAEIDKKMNELIALLAKSDLSSETAKAIRDRFNAAIKSSGPGLEQIEAFHKLDTDNTPREALLDEFSILLSNNQFDSKISKKKPARRPIIENSFNGNRDCDDNAWFRDDHYACSSFF